MPYERTAMNHPIYLDYNATTPVAPEVTEAIRPFLTSAFGNPSSSHAYGQVAREAVLQARRQVADLIGATAPEIVFTGCATEANNLALLGVARALGAGSRHLVVSAIEHPAVMAPARHLAEQGWELTIVPVDEYGLVSAAAVARSLKPETALVSIMHANNEVGTLQPAREIGEITRARGILFHTDAAQSAGKVPLDVDDLGVDLLTLAGHKFYATKGVGALYVRQGTPVRPVLFGADQEGGLRPGTENVAAIAGLGTAARLARERLAGATTHLLEMRELLHRRLREGVEGLLLNGHPQQRLPNTLHVSFPGVRGHDLLQRAGKGVAASVGSACHSEHDAVSGVLAAMGFKPARAAGAVRLSVGLMTTPDDIEQAAVTLMDAWNHLHATPRRG